MSTVTSRSSDCYLREQISIMTGLLAQMSDGYAAARMKLELRHLEAALSGQIPTVR